jgi:hypothetical protein
MRYIPRAFLAATLGLLLACTPSTSGSSSAAGGTPGDIGTWTEGPGTCPSGMTRVDIGNVSDLADASRYGLADNLVQGTAPMGAAGECISASMSTDPMFANAAAADFHPQSLAAVDYGAYSN